ncbi:MAG: ADP-ribosylglycohydrolase family protein [Candidatus Omnitrophota bacterium]
MTREDRLTGVLLGTAVGDALGLPYEGLPSSCVRERDPEAYNFSLFFGRGIVSERKNPASTRVLKYIERLSAHSDIAEVPLIFRNWAGTGSVLNVFIMRATGQRLTVSSGQERLMSMQGDNQKGCSQRGSA